ncbi:hypothetical protein O9929_07950 [Vibrio lentus]|nr:hypothetical protein [Vibrio lentus]
MPQLTEIGAWRGPDHALEPQYTHLLKTMAASTHSNRFAKSLNTQKQRSITVIL